MFIYAKINDKLLILVHSYIQVMFEKWYNINL